MPAYIPPILRDIPDHFETERLHIRVPRPGDGELVNEAVLESLDALRQWMPWVYPTPTAADSELYAREAAARFIRREEIPLKLIRKSDGRYVGSSGMHNIDWSVPAFEIGYWVRTSLQGQGYITEAVIGITQFAVDVLGAKRVEIRCDARNTRSAGVALRAGFTQEAMLRNQALAVDGTLRDTLIFAKIPGD